MHPTQHPQQGEDIHDIPVPSMFLLPRLDSTSCSETRHLEASLLLLSLPPAETFFKNYRRQLVYLRALVLGTQADGTRISSSADTEGSKHNQLKTARTFPPPIKCGEQCSQPFPGTLIWTPHPPDPGISASQRLRERSQGPGVSGRGEKWQESSVATAEGQRWLLTVSVKMAVHPLLSQCKAGAGGGCPAWGDISQPPCIQVGQEAHSF